MLSCLATHSFRSCFASSLLVHSLVAVVAVVFVVAMMAQPKYKVDIENSSEYSYYTDDEPDMPPPDKKVAAKAAPLPLVQAPVPPPALQPAMVKTPKAYAGTTSKASAPSTAGGSSKSAGTKQPRLPQSAAKSKESSASKEPAVYVTE